MVLTKIFFVVFAVFGSIVTVNSQTCNVMSEYGSCSSNKDCGCLPIALSDDTGICALLGVSCSQLSPCQYPDNTCESSNHICVIHPRCYSNPVCYPLNFLDPRLCPLLKPSNITRPSPIIFSNYSSELTIDDGTFIRPLTSSSSYYYEAIEVVVGTTGTYNITSLSKMDTWGFLYNGTFYPFESSVNLAKLDDDNGGNNQFKLTAFLQAGVPYTLVVSTNSPNVIGSFSVVASGPDYVYFIPINIMQTTTTTTMTTSTSTTSQSLVTSTYSSTLTSDSEKYPGSNKYYEAIEIMVNTSGIYTFTSVENMDGVGYLYQTNFDPSNPSNNLIVQDDQSGGNNQFRFLVFLEAGVPYTLVFTAYQSGITGPFSIVASGPDNVDFTPRNTSQTPTTSYPYEVTTSDNFVTSDYPYEVTTNNQNFFISNYSSELTSDDEKYPGSSKYYEAIEIMVNTGGMYTFTSVENIDGFGYLYRPSFDPSNPSNNLIVQDDQNGGNNQFRFSASLEAGVPYTLVFTTYQSGITGPFSVVASGPDNVDFTPINTTQTTSAFFLSPSTTITGATSVTSNYSSALTMNSETYVRDENATSSNYYYEAIQINVNTTGTYTFTSKSNIDTYGYIYQGVFFPSAPSFNLLEHDDDAGGNSQFQLTITLQADLTYILVVTTFSGDATGPFSIVTSGPDNVNFIPIQEV